MVSDLLQSPKFIKKDSLKICERELQTEEDIYEALKTAQKKMSGKQWAYVVKHLAMKIKKTS